MLYALKNMGIYVFVDVNVPEKLMIFQTNGGSFRILGTFMVSFFWWSVCLFRPDKFAKSTVVLH